MDLGMFFFISGLIVLVVSFVLWIVIEAKYSKGGSHVSAIVAGIPAILGVILLFISFLITPDMSLVKDCNNAVKEGYTFYKDGNAVQKPEALGIDKNNINNYKIKIDDKKKKSL